MVLYLLTAMRGTFQKFENHEECVLNPYTLFLLFLTHHYFVSGSFSKNLIKRLVYRTNEYFFTSQKV